MKFLCAVGIVLFLTLAGATRTNKASARSRLRREAVENCSKTIGDDELDMTLAISFEMLSDQGQGNGRIVLLRTARWTDERLEWDPQTYDGISTVHIRADGK